MLSTGLAASRDDRPQARCLELALLHSQTLTSYAVHGKRGLREFEVVPPAAAS